MAGYVDPHFVACLTKPGEDKSEQDLRYIYYHLNALESFKGLRDQSKLNLCREVRYESHKANEILYIRGTPSTCWYILLSGSVFIDNEMCLSRSSFGKKCLPDGRRPSDCIVLEDSEMVVVDYPTYSASDSSKSTHSSIIGINIDKMAALQEAEIKIKRRFSLTDDEFPFQRQRISNLISRADAQRTATASYSPQSSISSCVSECSSGVYSTKLNDHSIDISSLVDGDSDDEDDYLNDPLTALSAESLVVHDIVRECLEKEPSERTDDEIDVLLEFVQHLPAFSNITLAVRRALCEAMMFAVIERAGTVVLADNEPIDSWAVIVNGSVEISHPDGVSDTLQLGDSFGCAVSKEKILHAGTMRTRVDDCQFVCVIQDDFNRIIHQGEENTYKHKDNGQVVMVTEHRVIDSGSHGLDGRYCEGFVLLRGTPEKLIAHLMEDHTAIDPSYVEDFLLTYRCFLHDDGKTVADTLLESFDVVNLRDRVTRVVLLWVNNHYGDFENNDYMSDFLELFEVGLEQNNMIGQLRLMNIACTAKSRPRDITMTRSSKDEYLHFSITSGRDRGSGIFVTKIDRDSKAYKMGLRRADQILEVNGTKFDSISLDRALETLRNCTHLCLTVKFNVVGFKEMLAGACPPFLNGSNAVPMNVPDVAVVPLTRKNSEKSEGKGSQGHSSKLRKVMKKFNLLPAPINNRSSSSFDNVHGSSTAHSMQLPQTRGLSSSNPDLLCPDTYTTGPPSVPLDQIVKVYRSDQTYKYIFVSADSTTRDVVRQAIRDWSLQIPEHSLSLCQVTVSQQGVTKQCRLPDNMTNLADRISLNSRYYLKCNNLTETLVTDDISHEMMKDSQIGLLQLKCLEVAVQLYHNDFEVFNSIKHTEFIVDIFNLKSSSKHSLEEFEAIVNKETYWVVTEICQEPNLLRRVKLLKMFIKLAKLCKDSNNINTCFAIISGLGHNCVIRLRHTWEKLPQKYLRPFRDLEELMDPSRNMSRYRNLVATSRPPIIPFFPVVKKDLTFLHLANNTVVDGLINFEKLRMIAKEIRTVMHLASGMLTPRDLLSSSAIQKRTVSGTMTGSQTASVAGALAGVAIPIIGMQSTIGRSKKRRSSTLMPAKKLYEEALMVRKVRQYLKDISVIEDESKLATMSTACESSQIIHSRMATDVRELSPGTNRNSTTSASLVGTSDKFMYERMGSNSPAALKKLLDLTEEGSSGFKLSSLSKRTSSLNEKPPAPGGPKTGYFHRQSSFSKRRTYSSDMSKSQGQEAPDRQQGKLGFHSFRKSNTVDGPNRNSSGSTSGGSDSGLSAEMPPPLPVKLGVRKTSPNPSLSDLISRTSAVQVTEDTIVPVGDVLPAIPKRKGKLKAVKGVLSDPSGVPCGGNGSQAGVARQGRVDLVFDVCPASFITDSCTSVVAKDDVGVTITMGDVGETVMTGGLMAESTLLPESSLMRVLPLSRAVEKEPV